MNHTDILTLLTAAILVANTFHLTKIATLLKDAQAILGVTDPSTNSK